MTHYHHRQLQEFCERIFLSIGCSAEDALESAQTLLTADLRGVDSHGVARLSGYVRLSEAGRVNPQPQLAVVHQTPSTALVDADRALGLVSGSFAMQTAIEKAQQAGSGWVAVRNSNHYGIAGYHAMKALPHDMVGISLTNASPLVAPLWSAERLLGTNPIAVAIPAGEEPPFVLDMATSAVANGKLEILQRKNESAPDGWLQDSEGFPTTNPFGVKEGGALMPLGSDRTLGGHKGYGLGALVDILSGVLGGAAFGPWAPPFVSFLQPPENPPGEGLGHFFGAFRIDGFRPADEFKQSMDLWLRRFRQSEPTKPDRPVLVPGDPERETEAHRRLQGIPLVDAVVEDLQALGQRFNVPFPEELVAD